MRGILYTSWMFAPLFAAAQHPLINEVLPADQHTITGAQGHHPDAIEIHNPGSAAMDLVGFTVALGGTSQRITASLPITSHGCRVLYCDGHPERGPDHLDLRLPRAGGTLLLIDADRVTVRDVFTWPAMPADVSIGRVRDGGKAWAFFPSPSLGSSNNGAQSSHRLLQPPIISLHDDTVTCIVEAGTSIHFTLNGSTPTIDSPLYVSPITIANARTFTARSFALDAVPSAIAVRALVPADAGHAIALSMDPADLMDESRGIYATGDRANFSRSGEAWQRTAQVEWIGDDPRSEQAVGISIAGSGSRSAAKKNFKLFARDRFGSAGPIDAPVIGAWNEVLLRADASPNALLRNLFMDAIAQRTGARADAQPSVALPLYLNGAYWGTYRALPAKNAEWLRKLSGAESVDVVDGPGAHVLSGDNEHYGRAINALIRKAPMDSLAMMIDLNSLIDLACFDLYTGRADHDLNVRCWRSKTRDGKLRWILFDMDLWAPPEENSLERMCSASTIETPYVRQVLENTGLRDRLIARLCALLATELSPARGTSLAYSLFTANAAMMQKDFDRWKTEMPIPDPEACINALREHITTRPAHLLSQLAQRMRLQPRMIDARVEPANAGSIDVEDLRLTSDRRNVVAFAHVPMRFTAHVNDGMEFIGWEVTGVSGKIPSMSITVDPAKTRSLRALFRPIDLVRNSVLASFPHP